MGNCRLCASLRENYSGKKQDPAYVHTHTTYVFYLLYVRTYTNLHIKYHEKLEINGNNF